MGTPQFSTNLWKNYKVLRNEVVKANTVDLASMKYRDPLVYISLLCEYNVHHCYINWQTIGFYRYFACSTVHTLLFWEDYYQKRQKLHLGTELRHTSVLDE